MQLPNTNGLSSGMFLDDELNDRIGGADQLVALSPSSRLSIEDVLDEATLRASRSARADLDRLLLFRNSDRPSVVVLDDDPALLRLLETRFRDAGYTPSVYTDALLAADAITRNPPQVLVVDYQLPGLSGLDVLESALKNHPDIVAVMISGAADVGTITAAMRLGAMDFLIKPFDFKRLVQSVENGLDRHRRRLEQLSNQMRLEDLILERSEKLINLNTALERRTQELERAYHDVVHRLERASQWRDDETGEHIHRIGVFSGQIALAMGLSAEEAILITDASPMHDIGKIGVPDAVLLKPGRLTKREFEIMKTHTLIGAEILTGSSAPLLKASEEIALCHHECYDGSGYPRGLKGEEIPLFARIVAVADVFDALTHARPYKQAYTHEEALRVMAPLRGTQFDPKVFDAFLSVVDEFVALAELVEQEVSAKPAYGMEAGILDACKALSVAPVSRNRHSSGANESIE